MKITKLEHSCLLVEMPAPVNRTVLFDPGMMSEPFVDIDSLMYLDDIIITHSHGDHMAPALVKKLLGKFPDVRITGSSEVVAALKQDDILATSEEFEGVAFFDSPHEEVSPMFPQPEQIGVHYLDKLSHPGDSHSFTQTKAILALPVTAPWGSTVKAVRLAIDLKPQHIIPIHDWHWKDEARRQMYDGLEQVFAKNGITFHKLENGKPVVIDV
ncbi:MAG TPA: MBL fold metallo-hydrolase [Candidatus Saccharimonadales bacterium]|nr:MBL fold metallo-hydrolase [Candidatus Saccharimonadales bacterium]